MSSDTSPPIVTHEAMAYQVWRWFWCYRHIAQVITLNNVWYVEPNSTMASKKQEHKQGWYLFLCCVIMHIALPDDFQMMLRLLFFAALMKEYLERKYL